VARVALLSHCNKGLKYPMSASLALELHHLEIMFSKFPQGVNNYKTLIGGIDVTNLHPGALSWATVLIGVVVGILDFVFTALPY
jgi:hypothetical protein